MTDKRNKNTLQKYCTRRRYHGILILLELYIILIVGRKTQKFVKRASSVLLCERPDDAEILRSMYTNS